MDRTGRGALTARATDAAPGHSAIVVESPGMRAVVADDARVESVYGDGRWCEGPVWVAAVGGLVISDVRANRIVRIVEGGRADPVRDPSDFANGNALDAAGRLVSCEHLTRRVVRAERDGSRTVLADRHAGRPLNAPNDLVVARDGAVWFTDPTFGLTHPEEGRQREAEQRGRFVFRLDPGGQLEVVADSFEQPNGIAFSPDERTLYVSETSGGDDTPEGKREVRAFDVQDGRRLVRERVFATVDRGVPDGLRTDVDGRVYAGTDGGVRVWAPDGTPLGRIATPAPCANLAFGGPDGTRLFLCNGTHVHAVDVRVRGAAWRA